jgi:D-alanyl-D-alanine carboxypeptidase/D-alanyl-D-alanine-endopeptidase (penicillin-binding protein 4)
MPPALMAALRATGLPAASFGVYVASVDAKAPVVVATLNAEEPFLLASTAKVVTSLAALDLLGTGYQWRTQAFGTTPLAKGRLAGDLVIEGGPTGMTPAELLRWFKQMRAEGLTQIAGRIVLDGFSLLYENHPAQAATTAAESAPGGPPDVRTYNYGALVVSVQPARGPLASVTVFPRPPGLMVVNDVLMGGGCGARARWSSDSAAPGDTPQLLVSGRWDQSCGKQEVAFMKLPKSPALPGRAVAADAPRAVAPAAVAATGMVAALWAQAGGSLRGGVTETGRKRAALARPPWASQAMTGLPAVIREINKTSNNIAARSLLLSLAPAANLRAAQERVHAWLRTQGLVEGDIRIDIGSGQSRIERGKPRAMSQLLGNAWRAPGSQVFVDSLPVAGVDGTLANRMKKGAATGQAFLKTGTLSDTRALAGYVRAKSGKVYAVTLIVNHRDAARGTPALDAIVEWVAKNG